VAANQNINVVGYASIAPSAILEAITVRKSV
jgi:hypothetical protein